MYKDVKKKLLAVVLCVCMVLGAIEIVPRVQAKTEGGVNTVTLNYKGTTVDATVVAKKEDQRFAYTGSSHIPAVKTVKIVSGGSPIDITEHFETNFSVPTDRTNDNKNAGTFYAYLKPKTGTYTLAETEENRITFTITEAKIKRIYAKPGTDETQVLLYNGSDVTPTLTEVNVVLESGETVQYTGAEITENCKITPLSAVGMDQTSTVTLKESPNFSNETDSSIKTTVLCDVVYDLAQKASVAASSYNYTGADLSSSIKIKIDSETFDSDDNLKFSFEKKDDEEAWQSVEEVRNAGTYRMTVRPKNKTVILGNQPYGGTFVGTFEVASKVGAFEVTAVDAAGKTVILDANNTMGYRINIKDGKTPKELKVRVDGNDLTDYTLTYQDILNNNLDVAPTQAGTYYMIITPKASTNYGGKYTVKYNVYSELTLKSLYFEGNAEENPSSLEYSNDGYRIKEIVVINAANLKLTQGEQYRIKYQYQVNNTWQDADAFNSPDMLLVGQKRIAVEGIGAYDGENTYWLYQITGVEMTPDKFTVTVEAPGNWDYAGGIEIKPSCTVKYGTELVNPNYYKVSYKDNKKAGQATLLVTAKTTTNNPYTGSLTANFTINKLQLDDAECAGDKGSKYYYTGKAIIPTLKINDYELTSSDYEFEEYQDEAGRPLSGAPTEPGTYKLVVSQKSGQDNIVAQGSCSIEFEIAIRDISDDSISSFSLERTSIEWNGGQTEPKVICAGTLNLKEGIDYDVAYKNNTAPTASASAIITGKGNLTGEKKITFEITPRHISNVNIESDYTVNGTAPNYSVTLQLTDKGAGVQKSDLVQNTDYTVEKIVYKTEKGYEPSNLNGLERAGEYAVTLKGKGNYDDTREVTVKCGIDISDATISVGSSGKLTYNGKEQYPTITVKPKNGNAVLLEKDVTDASFKLTFERDSKENVPVGYEGIYAGTVYIQAVGNTKKGYFGTATKSAKEGEERASYIIYPMNIEDSKTRYEISLDNDEDQLPGPYSDNKVHYAFTNKPIEPKEQVIKASTNQAVSAPAILVRDVDYTIAYSDDCIARGTHEITVTGKGNFTGVRTLTFFIDALGIISEDITASFSDGDTYADGVPKLTLKLNGIELRDAALYDENADYQVNVSREDSGEGWLDTYVYTITGLGNFLSDRDRTEKKKVTRTILTRTEKEKPALKGTYVSEWDYDELIVSPEMTGAVQTPSKFTLTYKRKDGTTYNLLPEDYEVKSFKPTTKPGKGSTMVINGKGGFQGEATYDVPLFTDITKAKINKSSQLSDGGKISTDTLLKAMEKENGLAELLTFDAIWSDEGASIPTDCYTVSVPNSYTPTIGDTLTLTIAGNHEKYYTGTKKITVTVTGTLTNAKIEIGDNNTVPWKGYEIAPGTENTEKTAKVLVWDGKTQLKGGYLVSTGSISPDWDYYVTFSNNAGVGLATATFTGVNRYSGTISQTFKITCNLSDLIIQMPPLPDTADKFKYEGGRPEYNYELDAEKNKLLIELYYERKDDSGNVSGESRLDPAYYHLEYSGYESAGDATIVISESAEEANKGILLGSNRVVNYKLKQLTGVSITLGEQNPIYTGKEMTKEDVKMTVKYRGTELEEGTDYTLSFENAIDVGTATWSVYLKGNYTGQQTGTFNIKPMSLASASNIKATADTLVYTGAELLPKLTVTQLTGRTRVLEAGTDYKIIYYLDSTKKKYQENPFAPVGTYFAQIQGYGNYTDTLDVPYEIKTRELTDGVSIFFVSSDECPVVNEVPACIYTGKEHCPRVQVVYNQAVLTDKQYSVVYTNNVNAGTATITITGQGSFSGTRTIDFPIQAKDITGEDIQYLNNKGTAFEDEQEFEWTKAPVQPAVAVRDTTRNETLGTAEYELKYIDYNEDNNSQTNAGKVTISIKGIGNYTGEKKFAYYIGEDISKSYTLINGKSAASTTYNGLMQAPDEKDISVVWGASTDLTDENGNKRYRISYFKDGFEEENKVTREQIINAGNYYISVTGVPTLGTYAKSSKENSCVYTINARSIAPSYILVSGYDGTYYYNGQPIEPKGITVEDTDLPVQGDTSGLQKRSVKLVNGSDFDITYSNNVSAGKASIIVTGKGNYAGERVAYFNIVSSDTSGNNTWNGTSEGTGSITNGTTTIAASDIRLGFDNSTYNCMMYNGYERIPTVSINGVSTNEFLITASNNIRPGVATLMITGRGNNFTGTIIKNYTIRADLSAYGSISAIMDQTYTGYQLTPRVTVTCGGNLLNEGADYTVTYSNNTNVGRATVIVSAANDSYYVGTATSGFNISNTAGGMEITGYASSYTYTGNAITPDVVVMMNGRVLNRGTDYTVTYSNNTNVGTASMTVTGIGSFSGTKTLNFAIEAKNIENCLTTTVNNYQYTGNTHTPSVTLTDSTTGKTLTAGTDYLITYSNNTNPGTAQITVTALSKNYTGSKVISFKITSAAVSGLRATKIKNNSIKLAWSKQDYADGYQICNSSNRVVATTSKNSYTLKNLTSCKTYKYKVRSYVENADGSISYGSFSTPVSAKTMLNTPTLTAKSLSKGKVTLTWTKVSKATGYEIYYSTKKDGVYTKLKTVSKSAARKFVDSGLASGEKYYYTIRAYRKANGVKTYSNYNTIKAVKVK